MWVHGPFIMSAFIMNTWKNRKKLCCCSTRNKTSFSDIIDFPRDCFCSSSVKFRFWKCYRKLQQRECLSLPTCRCPADSTVFPLRLFMHPNDDHIVILHCYEKCLFPQLALTKFIMSRGRKQEKKRPLLVIMQHLNNSLKVLIYQMWHFSNSQRKTLKPDSLTDTHFINCLSKMKTVYEVKNSSVWLLTTDV